MNSRFLARALIVLCCVTGTTSALELVRLEAPTGDDSLAPRFTPLGQELGALTWLERRKGGHRLRVAEFDGRVFRAPRTIAEGESFFANWADTPGLIALPDGSWTAHWLERSGEAAFAYDIRVSRSADRGASWSAPTTPHRDGTQTEHGFVSTYAAAPGRAGLVWLDGRAMQPGTMNHASQGGGDHGSGAMTLRTATLGAALEPGDEALLDDRVCDCCGTAAGRTREGVVLAYRDRSAMEIRDIKLIRQTPAGWSAPIPVHEDGWRIEGCPVNGPALLAREETVIVAWFTLAGDEARIRLAVSRDGGRHFLPPLTLDRGDALGRVDLAWTPQGFAAAWMSQPGGQGVMRLARFDDQARLQSQADLVTIDGQRGNGFPRLLNLGNAGLFIAWTETGAAGGRTRVRVGRIDSP